MKAAALAILLAAGAADASMTRQQYDRAVEGLRANAERWRAGREIDPAAEIALKSVWFDANTAPMLLETLRTMDRDPNGLYVMTRLIWQLSFAERPTIRRLLPQVKALAADARKSYRPMLSLDDRQVAQLKRDAKQRAAKVAAEQEALRYNQLVYNLENVVFLCMARAALPAEDRELAEMLVRAEKKGSAVWLVMLRVFADTARHMTRERAKTTYDILRPHAVEIKWQPRRGYVHPAKADIRPADRSSFQRVVVYGGLELLQALNRIATQARQPALKVPKPKEIQKHLSEQAKKRKRGR